MSDKVKKSEKQVLGQQEADSLLDGLTAERLIVYNAILKPKFDEDFD